jgi:hypothetical protein
MNRPSRELVDAFFQWYRGDAHAQNEDCYAGQVTAEALSALPREQFIEFFYEFAMSRGRDCTLDIDHKNTRCMLVD